MNLRRQPVEAMYVSRRPIPAHKLAPPMGTDPVYLQKLVDVATEQMALAHEDGRLPYMEYIEAVKQQMGRA